MNIKPVKLIKSFSCDVLIYDDLCSHWLERATPDNISVAHLSTRFSYPIFICSRFWVTLLRYLIHFRRQKKSYFLAYLYALVATIQPKIVMTGADNNTTLASLAEIIPDVWFIFVQTALRDTNQGFPSGIKLPTYFAFGQSERLIFSSLGVHSRQYLPVGSIKLGYALSDPAPPRFAYVDLCFISTHRPGQVEATLPPLERAIEAASNLLFMHSWKYAQKYGLTLRVVAKSREPHRHDKERRHYQTLCSNYPFDFVAEIKSSCELDTYHALLVSDIVINTGSTLGFEALAAGKKVLFGASMNPQLIKDWGVSNYFDQVPGFMCVKQEDFSDFETKLNALRALPLAKYQRHTSAVARELIVQDTDCPPHAYIRETIRQYLLT